MRLAGKLRPSVVYSRLTQEEALSLVKALGAKITAFRPPRRGEYFLGQSWCIREIPRIKVMHKIAFAASYDFEASRPRLILDFPESHL